MKRFLISGFSFGFRISYVDERQTFESRNLKHALEKTHIVLSKLNKESEAGRIAGPFTVSSFPIFHCSPLGIVLKKDPSEFRLIYRLSYPQGSPVNDFFPDDCPSVSYASINDTIDVIKRTGAGCPVWPKRMSNRRFA